MLTNKTLTEQGHRPAGNMIMETMNAENLQSREFSRKEMWRLQTGQHGGYSKFFIHVRMVNVVNFVNS